MYYNMIVLKSVFFHLKWIGFYCVSVFPVYYLMCSQRYESWRTNVAAKANSLACCPKSWRSSDCRPRWWTWPALASLTILASLFWPMGWAWLLNEVGHTTMTWCIHTPKYNLIQREYICFWGCFLTIESSLQLAAHQRIVCSFLILFRTLKSYLTTRWKK